MSNGGLSTKELYLSLSSVTLTTIGFGDYVPKEPGAIEFWNIYVFVGLAVFAYILSLFSESMASHIHLVDDEDFDDEDEFAWEQCEDDPNAPWSSWSGMLGLEGEKWAQQQQQLILGQNGTEGDNMELVPGQEKNQPRPIHPTTFQEPDDFAHRNSLSNDQYWQLKQQQHQVTRNHGKRKSSAGRILLVPAKERKHMLEAEYYATHGGMMAQTHGGHADLADINAHYDTMYATTNGSSSRDHLNDASSTHSRISMVSVPTTIQFVDSRGVPHQRRRMSLVPVNGLGVGGMVGASAGLADNAPGEVVGHFDPYGKGITFGTPAYYTAMGKRRQQQLSDRSLSRRASAGGFERRSSILQRSGSNVTDRILSQSLEQMSSGSKVSTPTRQQVRFESPIGSPKSLAAQQILSQDQRERDRREWRAQRKMEEMAEENASSTMSTPAVYGQGSSQALDWDIRMDPLAMTSVAPVDSTKLPWPSEGDHDFQMPSELKYLRGSTSSEVTPAYRAPMSIEERSSPSPAVDFSQFIPSVQSSPRSIAATSGSIPASDSVESVGPLGEVRDTILKFEKDIDLNQVNLPLSTAKGHKMPKKKRSPVTSPVEISDCNGSRTPSAQSQESNDSRPSGSTLLPKLSVRKDIGPLNETRNKETILRFENNVDLNKDIEAPKAEPLPGHLLKNKGKKASQNNGTQPKDSPPGGVKHAEVSLEKSDGLTKGPPPPISADTQPTAPCSAPILRQPPLSRPSRQPPLSLSDSGSKTLQQTPSPPQHLRSLPLLPPTSNKSSYFARSVKQPHDGDPFSSSIPLIPQTALRRPSFTNNPNDKVANITTSPASMATTATSEGANLFSPSSSRKSSIATTITLGPSYERRKSASTSLQGRHQI